MAVKKANNHYRVNWLLSHNGQDFESGSVIELLDDEAEPLLLSGVIKLVGENEDVH